MRGCATSSTSARQIARAARRVAEAPEPRPRDRCPCGGTGRTSQTPRALRQALTDDSRLAPTPTGAGDERVVYRASTAPVRACSRSAQRRQHVAAYAAGRGRAGAAGDGASSPTRSVAFGDPRLADPVDDHVPGRVPGRQRPLGQRPRLAVRLSRARSAPGTRTATVRSDSEAGGDASRAPAASACRCRHRRDRFAFRPAARRWSRSQPRGGADVEEDQHFLLRLNGAAVDATRASRNAWCEVEGIGERLAAS